MCTLASGGQKLTSKSALITVIDMEDHIATKAYYRLIKFSSSERWDIRLVRVCVTSVDCQQLQLDLVESREAGIEFGLE
jgi:hypothetical protein